MNPAAVVMPPISAPIQTRSIAASADSSGASTRWVSTRIG